MSRRPLDPRVPEEARTALQSLLGREVSVREEDAQDPTELVVRYTDGAGRLVAAWVFQRVLVLALGAALTMIPRAHVEEAVLRGGTDADLEDNFREVANVLAKVAADILGSRAVLESVTDDRATLLRTARQVSVFGAHWSVLAIFIEGYPGGHVALALVPADDSGAE